MAPEFLLDEGGDLSRPKRNWESVPRKTIMRMCSVAGLTRRGIVPRYEHPKEKPRISLTAVFGKR